MLFLRCTNPDHQGPRAQYSVVDMTGEAERPLMEGVCPMCPAQKIASDPDRLPVCPCCGSTWAASGDETTCLPGTATEYMS